MRDGTTALQDVDLIESTTLNRYRMASTDRVALADALQAALMHFPPTPRPTSTIIIITDDGLNNSD